MYSAGGLVPIGLDLDFPIALDVVMMQYSTHSVTSRSWSPSAVVWKLNFEGLWTRFAIDLGEGEAGLDSIDSEPP